MPVSPSVSADAPDAGQHGTAAHDPAGGGPASAAGRVIVVHGAGVTDGAVPAEGVPVAATAAEAGAVDAAVVARLSRMVHGFADGDAPTASTMPPAPAPGQPGVPGAPMQPGVNESALAAWVAASGGAVALPAPASPPARRSGVGRRPGSPDDDGEQAASDDGEQPDDGESQPGTGDDLPAAGA
jgi:hypothetical protein